MRNVWLISKTIWIEAIRRREIYAIVILSIALILGARSMRFFGMEGFAKFYREIALQTMNVAASLTVILLAARQLPREFQNNTIYPLLAKPIGRGQFLVGKFLGVLLAGIFCYALFMVVFSAGALLQRTEFNWLLFAQFVYLQIWSLSILAALTCMLSLLMKTVDAAVTLALILYLCSQVFMNVMSTIYDYLDRVQQIAIVALHYLIPQLTLFDASAKVVHSMVLDDGVTVLWPNLAAWALVQLTLYGAVYTALYLALAWLLFRRRPL
jgi:Cu-processing system permease protein